MPMKTRLGLILSTASALAILAAATLAFAGDAVTPTSTSTSTTTTTTTQHLYLDIHRLGPGNVTAAAVAEAHQQDLAVQGAFDVDYQSYWVDETAGNIFCLVRAPSPEAAAEVHRRAHGLVADEIREVIPGK